MPLKTRTVLATGLCTALTTPAVFAACDMPVPGNGAVVTCTSNPPNPDTTPVVSGTGVSGVSLNLLAGSQLSVTTGPAVSLGEASTIVNAGSVSGTTAGILLREGSSVLTNSGTLTGTGGPGVLFSGSGNNQLINNGSLSGSGANVVVFGAGNDSLLITGGTINGNVSQGDGRDKTEIRSGTITGALSQGSGIDDFVMSAGSLGSLQQGDNRDTFTMTGGTITGAFEDGDVAQMSGGRIGRVDMKLDNNIFDMSGGQITGNLVTGFGNDTITVSRNSQIGGNVSVSGGTDSVTMTGGTVGGEIRMSTGNDLFHWEGGTINGAVLMGEDNDRIEFRNLSVTSSASSPVIDGGGGDDTLLMDKSQYVHRAANVLQGIEHILLTNGSQLTLQNRPLALGDAQNDAAGTGYAIDSTSTLALSNQNVVAFNSHLSGTGIVRTDTGGNAFAFTGNNAGDNFAGTLAVGNSTFDLSGLNAQALGQATLRAETGSVIIVGDGVQRTGGLAFAGGTVNFGGLSPGEENSAHRVQTAKLLDLRGNGAVRVGVSDLTYIPADIHDDVPLLAQDDGTTLLKLAGSDGTVSGSAGGLVLADETGHRITDSITRNIIQGGDAVAQGTWDWRLTTGAAQDGLYVAYALSKVTLQGQGDQALVLSGAGTTGSAEDLSARVTGSGDLVLDSGAWERVSLSNQNNDYTGITDVRSGTLRMNNNHVLGDTTRLSQAAGTVVQMNGYDQTVGELVTADTALTDLAGGSLTVALGGTVDGQLRGDGLFTLSDGTLDVHGGNALLSAQVRLLSGAVMTLDSATGAGTGDIDNAGTLNLKGADGVLANRLNNNGTVSLQDSQIVLTGDNRDFSGLLAIDEGSVLMIATADHPGSAAIEDRGLLIVDTPRDWTLLNSVIGEGGLTKDGGGTLALSPASAAYTGQTRILGGTLVSGSRSAPQMLASSLVSIESGRFAGNGSVAGDVDNQDILQVGAPDAGLPVNAADSLRTLALAAVPDTDALAIEGSLRNRGLLQLGQTGQNARAGNTLTVGGNYQGEGGRLALNTVLGDDSSLTDHLSVSGDTTGTTQVSVTNAGGSGAQTLNGIELISVVGTSGGEFTQAGRIVAGAYDYRLARGTESSEKNWYLTNLAGGAVGPGDSPSSPGSPGTPDTPGIPGTPDGNASATSGSVMLRPEAGSYISNLQAASTLFSTRLHDRLGETQYTDALTGEQHVTSLWLRQSGAHSGWRSDSGGLKTTANHYVVMLGGDVAQWSQDGMDRGHLGVMAGYGNHQSRTRSGLTGYRSEGKVEGYSAGLYGTWYANDAQKTGLYLDSWVLYNWFDNTVSGEGQAPERYDSDGLTASLESGYTWKTGEFAGSHDTRNTVYFQPQAQVAWMNVKADNHTERTGTSVSSDGEGNIQTRLGARLFLKSRNYRDEGKVRAFEPFIEANWLHNTHTFGVDMNDVRVSQAGARNIGELKTGIEGQLSRHLTVWGNVGQQIGDAGYSNTEGVLGVKYSW